MWLLQLLWARGAFYRKRSFDGALGRRLSLNGFLSEGSTRPERENSDKEKTNRELKDDFRRKTRQ